MDEHWEWGRVDMKYANVIQCFFLIQFYKGFEISTGCSGASFVLFISLSTSAISNITHPENIYIFLRLWRYIM